MTISSVDPTCPPEFILLAHRLADAAGAVARRYFRTPVRVEDKPDQSPVTIADREAEKAMRVLLAEAVPGHGILGEEWGLENTDAEWVWVLDPIDGTKAFITGKPSFGTLIALRHHGRAVLGMIDQPILGERWLGAAGQPTVLNAQPIRTRACDRLGLATLYATSPDMFSGADATAWRTLAGRVKLVRYGADCYAYGLLAAGFVDLVVEASLHPYDWGPMAPIIEGAGGIITDWLGRALTPDSDGRVVAAGDRATHAAALEALAQGSLAG